MRGRDQQGDVVIYLACVDEGHARRAMAQQLGDSFQAHAPVDQLGSERVAQLVGMDVSGAGPACHRSYVAMDGPAVEGLAVVADDQQSRGTRTPPGPVVGDEVDEHRVEGDVAVVVELADRDPQPVGAAVAEHGIVTQPAELTGPHAGASQQFDHESPAPIGILGQGGHELGGGGVVQKPRQGLVPFRKVSGVDGDPSWRVVVVPLDDPLEEGAHQRPSRRRRAPFSALPSVSYSARILAL